LPGTAPAIVAIVIAFPQLLPLLCHCPAVLLPLPLLSPCICIAAAFAFAVALP
jgi:hypothetical protein